MVAPCPGRVPGGSVHPDLRHLKRAQLLKPAKTGLFPLTAELPDVTDHLGSHRLGVLRERVINRCFEKRRRQNDTGLAGQTGLQRLLPVTRSALIVEQGFRDHDGIRMDGIQLSRSLLDGIL